MCIPRFEYSRCYRYFRHEAVALRDLCPSKGIGYSADTLVSHPQNNM